MPKRFHSFLVLMAFLLFSLVAVCQRELKIPAPFNFNLQDFPPIFGSGAIHVASKDSLVSLVYCESASGTLVLNLYHAQPYVVVCSLPFPSSNLATVGTNTLIVKNQSSANNYDLLLWDMLWPGPIARYKLNFPGLTVPALNDAAGSRSSMGKFGLFPPGPFPLQAGLGDFGWYVVDDQLNQVVKRSISCGIANTGASGGCFLDSGVMIYVGAATFSGTNQKYNVVVAADSAGLNPTRVVSLKRANGSHLNLTKVSECSAGILLADLQQHVIVLLDHQLTQVLWAKRLPPQTPLYSVPIEGDGGVLHSMVGSYTTIPWPNFPFYHSRLDRGHFGFDPQTGNVVYAKRVINSVGPGFSLFATTFGPAVLSDGKMREIRIFTDDYHSICSLIEVDTSGYLGCTQEAFLPVLMNDTVILDVVPAWVADSVGLGSLSAMLPTPLPTYLSFDPLEVQCECNPQLAIIANPVSVNTYQFSLSSSSYWFSPIDWDFGDGTQATGNTPTHTFPGPGTYQVVACKNFNCGPRCDTLEVVVTSCPATNATFTFAGNTPYISFNSSGSVGSLQWLFGDGTTSTATNPAHNYTASGNYNVCLIASNFCTSDTFCQIVTVVCPLPTTVFTWTTNNLTATFDATGSIGNGVSWNFGDGTYYSLLNASHTYLYPGTYNVCLTISNPCGNTTVCHLVTVTCPPPAPTFSYNAFNLNAAFNNTGIMGTYLWQFGDGATSTQSSTSHTYAAAGTYNVCLSVTSMCGTATTCQQVTLTCPNLPIALFASNTSPIAATFNSSGSSGGLLWQFGDGDTSNSSNPIHTYTTAGTYNVCLIATNSCGSDTTCQQVQILCGSLGIPAAPTIAASGPTTICAGDSVVLSSNVGSGNVWSPSGDTTQSLVVTVSGTYSVTHSVQGCASSPSNTIVVAVLPSPQSPTISPSGPTSICQGDSVTLTASPASSYAWSNGATTSSITVNASGNYQVTVTDANGCSSTSTGVSVSVNPPPPIPSITPSGPTTFCQGDSVTLTASPASNYAWSNGATTSSLTLMGGGTFWVTAIDSNGCYSSSALMLVTVNPLPAVPSVAFNGQQLSTPGGFAYQWYLNGLPVAGATDSSFVPTVDGYYHVVVTDANGCTAQSAVIFVTIVARLNPLSGRLVLVPNPSTGKFKIVSDSPIEGRLTVYNAMGMRIYASADPGAEVDLSAYSKGTYFVKVMGDRGEWGTILMLW